MAQTRQVGKTATTIAHDGKHNVLTYHSTQVVKWNEKEIVLNSGGWKTATTKLRMDQCSNQFNLGYQVSQKDFSWFVIFKGKEIAFVDGIVLKR